MDALCGCIDGHNITGRTTAAASTTATKRRRLITVEEIDGSAPAAAARTTSLAEGRLTDIQDPELVK